MPDFNMTAGDVWFLVTAGIAGIAIYCVGRIDGYWKAAQEHCEQLRTKAPQEKR